MSQHDAFHDDGPPIAQLHAAVKSLDAFVHSIIPPELPSAAAPPATSLLHPATTPIQLFSRQEIVARKWKDLARSHVAVCGLGGIGTLAANALARTGVGRLLLVDNNLRLDWSCMGQMGFHPEEVGFSRTQALRLRLQSIRHPTATAAANNSVDSFSVDWNNDADLLELRKKLKASSVTSALHQHHTQKKGTNHSETERHGINGGDGDITAGPASGGAGGVGLFEALTQRRPYDVVLSCLDDDADRLTLNQICLELSLPLLHVALSPCNTKIFLRTVLPGHTCCLECLLPPTNANAPDVNSHTNTTPAGHGAPPPQNAMDQVAKSIAKAFPASLPHVELLAGGLVAQHAIKFLLEVGDFVPFLTVNALTFEMESYAFPPNRVCANATCRERQDDELRGGAARY